MELHFNATEIGCTEDDGALVCGASNSKSDEPYHYITIQGCSDPDDEDDVLIAGLRRLFRNRPTDLHIEIR